MGWDSRSRLWPQLVFGVQSFLFHISRRPIRNSYLSWHTLVSNIMEKRSIFNVLFCFKIGEIKFSITLSAIFSFWSSFLVTTSRRYNSASFSLPVSQIIAPFVAISITAVNPGESHSSRFICIALRILRFLTPRWGFCANWCSLLLFWLLLRTNSDSRFQS